MILLLLTWLASGGGLSVRIEARVSEDLTRIVGQMHVEGDGPFQVVDPLSTLPDPEDDRTLLRTAKGRLRRGEITFEPISGQAWSFETALPRDRFGDVGAWKNRRLFGNGAWYPQILVEGSAPVVAWQAEVTLPAGITGAVGNVVGAGTVTWSGEGERISLAAIKNARSERLGEAGAQVVVLDRKSRRRTRRILRRDPASLLAKARGRADGHDTITVVVSPNRRRLARPGLGMVYLSDRAWRITPGLRRYHDAAVTEALLAADLDIADPYERALAASLLTTTQEASSAQGLLRWFSWNPVVDAILNDRRMPFWGDVFTAAHPEDPLRDDLVERYRPHAPTRALAEQLSMVHDRLPLRGFAEDLSRGRALEAAARHHDLDHDLIQAWRTPYPSQDYILNVSADGVRITRHAQDDALPEILAVRVQGQTHAERFERGPGTRLIPTRGRPGSAVIDPRGLARQQTRAGDAYPPRLITLWAAWIDAINLTEGFISGHALAWARGRDDNRNTGSVWIQADQQDLPAITLGWQHRRGPRQDGLARPHRLSISSTTAWSNPAFADGDRPVFTVDGAISYAWDTRISALFPVRGRRLFAGVSGGVAPGQKTRWGRASTGFTGIVSPHPRWAFVGRANVAVATGDTRQRLLWLGGPGAGASLPPGVAIGDRRAVAQAEWRWAPIRNASWSLFDLAWVSEIQLTVGAEAVALRPTAGDPARLVGVTAGGAVVSDVLGANPGLIGVTVGVPAWIEGVVDDEGEALEPWAAPQISLRFGQAF